MDLKTVTTIPLFDSVPKRRHEELTRLADEIDVPSGATLMREGGYALEFVVVVSGTADVLREGKRIATLGPGDFFGEVGMLSANRLRTATVVATSPMRLVVVAPREFQELMSTLPSVAEPVRRAAAARS